MAVSPWTIALLLSLLTGAHSKFFAADEISHSSATALLDWLAGNDVGGLRGPEPLVKVSVIQPDESNGESQPVTDLELQAVKEIPAGTEILDFPPSLLISARHVARSSAPFDGAGEDATLTAWILTEKSKGPSSSWFPFIDSLPKKWNHPIFWSGDTLDNETDFKPVVQRVYIQRDLIHSVYERCVPDKIASASLEEFTWAFITVKSLEILITAPQPDGSSEAIPFLLPLPDFRTLADNPDVLWGGKLVDGRLKLYAKQDISADSIIQFSYPFLDSASLLTNFGFLPNNNPFDKFILFHNIQGMVDYFLNNYTSGLKFPLDGARAVKLATVAVDQVNKELTLLETEGKKKFEGFSMDLEKNVNFGIGQNNNCDPRMIAAFTSLATMIMEGYEMNRKKIAAIASYSIKLGSNEEGFSCYELEAAQDEFVLTLRAGVHMIQSYIKHVIESFRTSYMEDYEIVFPSPCENKLGKRECKMSPFLPSKELELAVRLRMSKKLLLLEFLSNLNHVCEGLPYSTEDEEDYEDVGEYDEEELERMKGESGEDFDNDEYEDDDYVSMNVGDVDEPQDDLEL